MRQGINSGDHNGEPVRDAALGRLLHELDTPAVLSWSAVESIVTAAPAVRVPWYAVLSRGSAGPLRYATALAAVLILGSGLLAVIPAQADRVGTIISAQLPTAWHSGSTEMAQLETAVRQRFAALSLPQSQLYLLNVTQRSGRPELALVMQNVDVKQASAFYAGLAQSYPALSAFARKVEPVEAGSPGSVLSVMLTHAVQPGRLARLDENAARIHVLQALRGMGLTPTEVSTQRAADGTLIIEISAEMRIEVQGHSQEDLRAVGLSRDNLGDSAYEELLNNAAH